MRRAEFAGANPDDFLKTSDSCTGVERPAGGLLRDQGPLRADRARATGRRRCGCSTTRSRARTTRDFTGVGAAPSTGGGSTGPQGPPGPAGPQGPAGTNGTNGTNGATGRRASTAARGGPARPAPPARRAPGRDRAAGPARPRRHGDLQAEEVALGQGAGDVHGALRVRAARQGPGAARARAAASTRASAASSAAGHVSLRVRPTTRLRHARYRLLLTFVDRKGRATTLSQRVRLMR